MAQLPTHGLRFAKGGDCHREVLQRSQAGGLQLGAQTILQEQEWLPMLYFVTDGLRLQGMVVLQSKPRQLVWTPNME